MFPVEQLDNAINNFQILESDISSLRNHTDNSTPQISGQLEASLADLKEIIDQLNQEDVRACISRDVPWIDLRRLPDRPARFKEELKDRKGRLRLKLIEYFGEEIWVNTALKGPSSAFAWPVVRQRSNRKSSRI